jgi:hypothetical protein
MRKAGQDAGQISQVTNWKAVMVEVVHQGTIIIIII